MFLDQLFVGIIEFNGCGIIVRIGDVIMIGNVRIDATVASFWNVFLAVWVTLLVSSAVS